MESRAPAALWGFLLYALVHAVVGRNRDVGVVLWVLGVVAAGPLLLQGGGR